MAETRHIDYEEHAASTLELLEDEKMDFVQNTLSDLRGGILPDEARDRLVRRMKSRMRDVIFEHLKRSGVVRGDYRHDFTLGYCRRKYIEPRTSDVPSRYLDIDRILPNFQEIVDTIMAEAGKLKSIAEIEATTCEAGGTSSQSEPHKD